MQMTYIEFLKRALIFVAIAVLPVLIWYLFGVVLMAFGAIILAMLLRLVAQPFMRWLSLPEPLALAISGALILGVLVGAGYLFGSRITTEFQDVTQRAISASADLHRRLEGSPYGKFLLDHFSGSDVSVTGVLSGLLKISSRFLEALVIMVISAVYLAAQPRHYRDGLIWLFAPRAHAHAARIVDGIGEALHLWLIGQLIEMFLIGALSALAVWMIGVPSPLALWAYRRDRRVHPLCRAASRRHPSAPGSPNDEPAGDVVDYGGLSDHPSDQQLFQPLPQCCIRPGNRPLSPTVYLLKSGSSHSKPTHPIAGNLHSLIIV